MTATISRPEAEKVLKMAFPVNTPTIEHTPKGAFHIVDKDGKRLGSAFDLRIACQQAVKPILEKASARSQELAQAKEQEFRDFMQFLREKHDAEFDQWRQERLDAIEASVVEAAAPLVTL